MKIKDYKCKCGHDDFFFDTADKGSPIGIYCSYCGKWLKWAGKDEQNLRMKQVFILDKIRAEIVQNAYPIIHGVNDHELGMTLYGILQVFDKYKVEGEGKGMKYINDGKPVCFAKPSFIEQITMENIATTYNAGIVCKKDGNFIIGYEMKGAEVTFSIGQPVYDIDGNIMGWLGIGLFSNLDYSSEIRIPCDYWQICLPTKYCVEGKKVYTYWQNKAKWQNKTGK